MAEMKALVRVTSTAKLLTRDRAAPAAQAPLYVMRDRLDARSSFWLYPKIPHQHHVSSEPSLHIRVMEVTDYIRLVKKRR